MVDFPAINRMRAAAEKRPAELKKVSLIEVAGQNRVLVERHFGVLAYSLNEIQVKVSFGKLIVKGSELLLSELNREQLVIHGCIESLQLFGGKCE